MKVIVAGCTGFVGGEVLDQCLNNPSITSVIALSRRPLSGPVANHPKLIVSILDDFLSYPESLLQDLRGAEACIWALGKATMWDMEMFRKINLDYTIAAVRAFDENLALSVKDGKPFRFVYCSGAATEKDQDRSLWVAGNNRRIRGQVENELIAYAKNHHETMETYIVRPAAILSKQTTLFTLLLGLGPSIRVDALAGAMIDAALHGNQHQLLENTVMAGRV